jgi:hypothetical protein
MEIQESRNKYPSEETWRSDEQEPESGIEKKNIRFILGGVSVVGQTKRDSGSREQLVGSIVVAPPISYSFGQPDGPMGAPFVHQCACPLTAGGLPSHPPSLFIRPLFRRPAPPSNTKMVCSCRVKPQSQSNSRR